MKSHTNTQAKTMQQNGFTPGIVLPIFSRLAVAVMLLGTNLHALDLHWDPDGAGGGCGGAGAWNTTGLFWSTNLCAEPYVAWSNSGTNSATFGGTAPYVVTVPANLTVNKLTNTSTGGAVTFTNSSSITFNGDSPTIDSATKIAFFPPLKGPGLTLIKTGAGQLQLNNNAQTFAKYIIAGGTISSANTNKWGTGVGNAADAVTLDGGGIGNDTTSQTYNNWGITLGPKGGSIGVSATSLTCTINTRITGAGPLVLGYGYGTGFTADGFFVLGNTNNNYTGATTVSNGTLRLGAAGVIPNGSTLTLRGGTILDLNNFNETIGGLSSSGAVNLGDATLTVSGSANTTYSGIMSGTGNLVKGGSGRLILSGNNTYSGKTTINGGRISINADSRLGTAPGSPVEDQIKFGGGILQTTEPFDLSPMRGITLAGNGTWEHTNDLGEVTYSGNITGTGNFTKSGDGTLVLNGVNTYVGNTTVSDGILKLGVVDAIPLTSPVAVNGSTNLLDINTFDVTFASLSGTGVITNSGSGSVTITNGTLAAGTSLTGNAVGLLTLQNSLSLTNSTNRWELAALLDDQDGTPGTSFDQVLLTAGSLNFGESNVLSINFMSNSAPDFATPFWQVSHKWTVIKLQPPAENPNPVNFISVKTNTMIYAGTFSTAIEADGISLNFTPEGPTAPIMLTQPQNTSIAQSSNATLTVGATGTAPLQYLWYFGSTLVSEGTSATLTIPNAQPGNEGQYHVVISNDFGTLTSSNVTLTVVIPPVINDQPDDQTVDVGGTAFFSVTATGGLPLSYQWKKGGTNIPGATTTSLTLSSVSTNDAAGYTVLVTNLAGSVLSSNAVLTVNTTPPPAPVLGASLTGEMVTLLWTSVPSRTYRPQFKNDLNATNWTDITPDVVASGATSSITNNVSGQTQRYYRVMLLP